MIDLAQILAQKISSLEKHLQSAIFERDHSATPMESHSDKSRQIAEQMIDSLGDEIKHLQSIEPELKKYHPILYTLSTPLGDKQFALVPEGLGGQTIEGFTLITQQSPLGSLLVTAKVGDEISLNGQIFTVTARS